MRPRRRTALIGAAAGLLAQASLALAIGPCGPVPCDLCPGGGNVAGASVRIVGLGTPPGDDRLLVKGAMTIPQSSTIAPELHGLRLAIHAADGSAVVDALLPGGLYGGPGQSGWVVRGKGTRFQYRVGAADPPAIHGIVRATVTLKPRTPGYVHVKLEGKASDYRVLAAGLPLQLSVVIDPANAIAGQCADESFGDTPPGNPERCEFDASGAGVRCR